MIQQVKKKVAKWLLTGDNKRDQRNRVLYEKYSAYTMIPAASFSANLNICEKALNIPGTIVECGVWRGGMMAAISELLGKDREYFLFDSYEGLPEVKEIDGVSAKEWQNDKSSPHYFDNCKAEIEFAQKAMKLAGVNDAQFIKGWFSDTLSSYDKSKPIGLLRLDCDWYDSVLECLERLFPLVAKDGLILIDDYFAWDGCAIAVHDYLSKHRLPNRINTVDRKLAYIIK